MRSVAAYRGKDRRDLPAYPLPEAAFYLRVPVSTLRQWVSGKKPVIPQPTRVGHFRVLSFNELVECHILAGIRREHGVTLPSVRKALRYVRAQLDIKRPLLDQQFETDGANLFVTHMGKLINASKEGQLGMRALLSSSLRRVDRDPQGLPIRLYPFVGPRADDAPRHVVVDPGLSFGRPVLAGTGIPTTEIALRARAGESLADLADDFNVPVDAIWHALTCESREAA